MGNKLIVNLIKFSPQLYIGWVLIIALLTLLPGKVLPNIDWDFLSLDKVIHFTVFLIMSFLGGVSFKFSSWSTTIKKPAIISILIAILYGTVLEYSQSFIPQRAFDYADLTANIGGSVLGIAIFLVFNTKIKII